MGSGHGPRSPEEELRLSVALGNKLRQYRVDRGLSQRDIAALLGVSQGYVSNVEGKSGRSSFTIKTLENFSQLPGMDFTLTFSGGKITFQ